MVVILLLPFTVLKWHVLVSKIHGKWSSMSYAGLCVFTY
jgi:hypothetical protein